MVSVNRPRIVLEREQTKDGLRTKPLPMFAKGRNKGVVAYVKWQKRNEAEARQEAERKRDMQRQALQDQIEKDWDGAGFSKEELLLTVAQACLRRWF